ncbi:NlpC/P60 family protein [Naumannella huperziae]
MTTTTIRPDGIRRTIAGIAATLALGGGLAVGVATTAPIDRASAVSCAAQTDATAEATAMIDAACAEVAAGTLYSWGGGHDAEPGPSTGIPNPDAGYDHTNRTGLDCSGLVRWAWFKATGVDFGGVATSGMPDALEANGFTDVGTDEANWQPGDIIIWTGHTAIYLGGGQMVQAQGADEGLNVKPVSSQGDRTRVGTFRHGGDGGGTVPPPSPGGQSITVYATDVNVRSDATSQSTSVGKVSQRAANFTCQKRGESVSSEGYTNDLWSYSDELGGYVNNVFLQGPADFGLPTC